MESLNQYLETLVTTGISLTMTDVQLNAKQNLDSHVQDLLQFVQQYAGMESLFQDMKIVMMESMVYSLDASLDV